MAIMAECPFYHRKQGAKNKQCKCGADLVQLKRSKRSDIGSVTGYREGSRKGRRSQERT